MENLQKGNYGQSLLRSDRNSAFKVRELASLNTSDPTEVLMHYRTHISNISEEYIKRIMIEIKEIHDMPPDKYFDIWNKRLHNLMLQQKEFEDSSSDLKIKVSSSYSSTERIVENCEAIKEDFIAECALFDSFLPAYGYKSQIIERCKINQVSIVQTHSYYYFQVLIPIILKKLYPQQMIVSCESSSVTKKNLQNCLNNFIHKPKITEFKSLCKEYVVTSENELLDLFYSQKISLKSSMSIIYRLKLDRTLVSDILMSYIREILSINTFSKLILIIPPFANYNDYQNYFSNLTVSSLLKTPGLSFPVTSVWRKESLTPSMHYLEDVARTVLSVQALQGAGDIMVCLSSSRDIDYVNKKIQELSLEFKMSNLKIVTINEFASYNINVRDLNKDSSRIVFLASKDVEMIAIKTVRFVIDCGIQKTQIYKKNNFFNKSRDTFFISQENVKLRKILAGVSKPGVCFHLYSKRNYLKDMHSFPLPEVLIADPTKTLLTIYHHRRNDLQVQLIQPLPKNLYDKANEDLKKYGAILNMKLTAKGENMLLLPFPVERSHLILSGMERGLLFETIVLVAFFSEGQQIFQTPVSDKQKQVLCAKKLKLIQNESDTLTYIYIYKSFIAENFSSSWCEDNFIQLDVLQRIHKSVNEICQIVQHCLDVPIIKEFSVSETFGTDFINLLFDSFHHNLCVYTGHEKSGYRILSSSSLAHIGPFCVLSESDNLPQFIIYDQTVSLHRNILIHVTVIPTEVVLKSLADGLLDFDYSDLFEKNLICRSVEPIGDDLMKRLLLGSDGKKVIKIENQLKKETASDFIFVEPSLEKGRVDIYAMPEHIDFTYCAFKDMLGATFDGIVNEQQVEILELKKGKNIIYVEMNCAKGAVATTIKISSKKQSHYGSSLPEVSQENEVDNQDDTFAPFNLHISWVRRSCSGRAYVTFNNSPNFLAARKMAFKYVKIMGTKVFVQVSKKQNNQLILNELPPESRAHNLQSDIKQLLPELKVESIDLEYEKPFDTLEDERNYIKFLIKQKLKEFDLLSECDITILEAKSSDIDMTAHIRTYNPVLLDFVSGIIKSTLVENKKIVTEFVFSASIKCNTKICEALQPRFISELNQLTSDFQNDVNSNQVFEFTISKESDVVRVIELSTKNSDILLFLYKTINFLLEGDILDVKEYKGYQNLFFHGGHVWLRCLEKAENVLIVEDPGLKLLKLYGSLEECESAKYQIAKFLEDAESDIMYKLSLARGHRNLLLKAVIKEYGVHLEGFIEDYALKTAILDIRTCEILLRGNRDNVEKAESRIQELSDELDIETPAGDLSQETCPVCFCPAIGMTFRLQHCGHLYCLFCIQALLEKAEFPLRCCFENCSKDVTLTDIRNILRDELKRKTLFEKTLREYIDKNRENISFCPAADCPMFFFKKEATDNKITCNLCKNDICIRCNVLFHGGFSCDMYQDSKNDPDYSFKVWQKNKQCKQCPRCKAAIEKIAGCNRMNCSSCKGTFCWICVREFSNEKEVYNHIHSAHRGQLFMNL